MNLCFLVAQGRRGGVVDAVGALAGCSIRSPRMCGQGHRQSGSLKVGAKTLS